MRGSNSDIFCHSSATCGVPKPVFHFWEPRNQDFWHTLALIGTENQLVIYTFIFPGGRIFASQKWGGVTLKSLANVVHKIKLFNSLLHQQNQGEQTGRGSRPHEDQYQRGQIRYQPQKNGQSR
jgi:hypothetical protein